MGSARQVSSASISAARQTFRLVAVAALAATLVAPATGTAAVDIGPLPGPCPTSYAGPYPAHHVYCVRTSDHATLSVTPAEVADGTEVHLTLDLVTPDCSLVPNGTYPCVARVTWPNAGDATGSGPSYRLIDKVHTYFRYIGTKPYYYIPFLTQSAGGVSCTAGSVSFAPSCTFKVVYRAALGQVPPSWGVWIIRLDVRTAAGSEQTVWLEAVSRVLGEAPRLAATLGVSAGEVLVGERFTVSMNATNTGTQPLDDVGPAGPLVIEGGGRVRVLRELGPASAGQLDPGARATFSAELEAVGGGDVVIRARAQGTSSFGTLTADARCGLDEARAAAPVCRLDGGAGVAVKACRIDMTDISRPLQVFRIDPKGDSTPAPDSGYPQGGT